MLTGLQERFCNEYIVDLNGTQAAIRAGYSELTAKTQAARLLTLVHVRCRVSDLTDGLTERVKLSAESVLEDIRNIKASCMGLLTNDPKTALKACELEAKYLGLLTDRLDLSGTVKTESTFWIEFKAADENDKNV